MKMITFEGISKGGISINPEHVVCVRSGSAQVVGEFCRIFLINDGDTCITVEGFREDVVAKLEGGE